jgi:shikimate dehydrogenase
VTAATALPITGRTRLFGVIADPIGHVRACEVFNPVFAARGIDAVLVPLHVPAGALRHALDGFRALGNLGGILVTIPHKESVLDLVDEVGAQARLVGAANIIRRDADGRLAAENFDGLGFVAGLRRAGQEVSGRRVLLVGAGGAGKAIACALAEAKVETLLVANRTPTRAEDLAARVKAAYPSVDVRAGPNDPSGFDIVVNATSQGLHPGDAPPFAVDAVAPEATVAEIIMKPERTPLVAAAAARGLRVHLGRHMLDAQVPLMTRFLDIDAGGS